MAHESHRCLICGKPPIDVSENETKDGPPYGWGAVGRGIVPYASTICRIVLVYHGGWHHIHRHIESWSGSAKRDEQERKRRQIALSRMRDGHG